MEPEAAAGLWFSDNEIARFRNKTKDALEVGGLTDQSATIRPYELDPNATSARNLEQWITAPMGAYEMSFRLRQSDHPDFGRGIEILGVTNVIVHGGVRDEDRASNGGVLANVCTSLMNAYQADEFPALLNIGGWTTWRGQLMWTSFIDGESFRQLLSLGLQGAGVILSLLLTEQVPTSHAFAWLMTESWLSERADLWNITEQVEWDGVQQNAGLLPLLVPNGVIDRLGFADAPLNQLIGPFEIDGTDAWFQHTLLLATWGIFNPMGPSVGSLEICIDFESQRALLVERLRHPFSPRVAVHAVLDFDGFSNRADLVAEVIGGLEWSSPDWFEITDYDPAVKNSLREGMRLFAGRSDEDFRRTTQLLLASIGSPWARLSSNELELPEIDGDPIETWIEVVTSAANIDNHLAYLRSAWEGAVAYQGSKGDPNVAQSMTNRLVEEVVRRSNQV